MSLTIDEAIARFEANAEQNERWASGGLNPETNAEYAAEHRQLAEWLRELQERRKEPEKAQLSQEGTTSEPTIQPVATDTNVGNNSEIPNSSDCISRQQALDAVGKYASVWMEYTDAMSKDEIAQIALNNAKSTMIRILKELPTVQPEVLACGNGELVAKPEPQWIPISDRLPRDGSWNIFTDGKNISVERYKADAIDHFFPNGRWFQLEDVIAWMPLPSPYQKGATA